MTEYPSLWCHFTNKLLFKELFLSSPPCALTADSILPSVAITHTNQGRVAGRIVPFTIWKKLLFVKKWHTNYLNPENTMKVWHDSRHFPKWNHCHFRTQWAWRIALPLAIIHLDVACLEVTEKTSFYNHVKKRQTTSYSMVMFSQP